MMIVIDRALDMRCRNVLTYHYASGRADCSLTIDVPGDKGESTTLMISGIPPERAGILAAALGDDETTFSVEGAAAGGAYRAGADQ